MYKLLMMGTNTGSVEMVKCAQDLGAYVIVSDYLQANDSKAKQFADECWLVDTADTKTLMDKCISEGVSGIFTGVSDFNVTQAVRLSEATGIPFYCSSRTWHFSRNKADFKAQCRECGVPTAKQYSLSDIPTRNELDAIEFPVIVKPADRSANIGFSYCNTESELLRGYELARSASEAGSVVVEKLLTGREYTAFYVLADGEARLLNLFSMFSQPGMPDNCYSISMSISDVLPYYMAEINPSVKSMFKSMGHRDGVVWVEFMEDEDGTLNALEVGHRLSGEMLWRPLSEVYGFDSMKWLVNYALKGSNSVALLPSDQADVRDRCACSYILWTKHKGKVSSIEGLDSWNKDGFTVNSIVKPGVEVDAYRYAAIVAFSADSYEDMISIIKDINDSVHILDDNGEEMVIKYDDFSALKSVGAVSR